MNRKWLERELEDAIVANPMVLFEAATGISESRGDYHLIGRQVKCRTGIIDILFTHQTQLCLVELKAVRATEETIGQVARYKEALQYAASDGLMECATDSQKYKLLYPPILNQIPIYCFIVAPSFTPQAVMTCSYWGYPLIVDRKENGNFVLSNTDNTEYNDTDDEKLNLSLKDFYCNLLAEEESRFDARQKWEREQGYL